MATMAERVARLEGQMDPRMAQRDRRLDAMAQRLTGCSRRNTAGAPRSPP
jgi:hypothetical protein